MEQMYVYKASVEKVVDGDTIDFLVDCGFHVHVSIRTRLLGVNAPELSVALGKEVRDWLRSALPVGTVTRIQTFKEPGDKYGRWLAIVDAPPNEFGALTLADLLIAKGYAVNY